MSGVDVDLTLPEAGVEVLIEVIEVLKYVFSTLRSSQPKSDGEMERDAH
jgi:hypothetical protein